MKFKEWLQISETGTGTNAIAGFSRPIGIGMVRKTPIDMMGFRDEDKKRKNKS